MRPVPGVVVAAAAVAMLGAGYAAAPQFTVPSFAPSAPSGPGLAGESFDGPAISNEKGTFQVRIIVDDGVVTDVRYLQVGTMAVESARINGIVIPLLRQRILEAQTWDVEYVSGASFSSPALVNSAKGAFEAAGLG